MNQFTYLKELERPNAKSRSKCIPLQVSISNFEGFRIKDINPYIPYGSEALSSNVGSLSVPITRAISSLAF